MGSCSYWNLDEVSRRLLGALGRAIGLYPLPFLILPCILTLGCFYPFFIGFRSFRKLSLERAGAIELFTPSNSESQPVRQYLSSVFPDGGYFSDRTVVAPNLFILLVSAADGGTIWRSPIVDAYFELRRSIEALNVTLGNGAGPVYNYSTFCASDPLRIKCHPDPFLEIWQGYQLGQVKKITYPYISVSFSLSQSVGSHSIYVGPLFGGVVTNSTANYDISSSPEVVYTKYVRLIINLPRPDEFQPQAQTSKNGHQKSLGAQANSDAILDSQLEDIFQAYGLEFLNFVQNYQSPLLRVAFWETHQYAIDMAAIGKRVMRLLPVLVGSLLAFSIASCCMRDVVLSKPWLALSAVISAAMGILAGFTTMFLAKIQLIEIAMIVPFLVLSIGVDDAFVMLNVWRKTCIHLPVPERLRLTYTESAVSITVTTLTDAAVFAIGCTAVFPAVRLFCAFAAVSIGWVFAYQITFFGAAMAYSGRREASGRNSCLPCITTNRAIVPKKSSYHCPCGNLQQSCEASVPSSSSSSSLTHSPIASYHSRALSSVQPWPTIFFKVYYSDFIALPTIRIVAMLSYVAYVTSAAWLIFSDLEQGLKLSSLVPYDTSTHDYLYIYETYFTKCSTSAEVVILDRLDYFDPRTQRALFNYVQTFEHTDHTDTVDFWLRDFADFQATTLAAPSSRAGLMHLLRHVFLALDPYKHHSASINFIDVDYLSDASFEKHHRFSYQLDTAIPLGPGNDHLSAGLNPFPGFTNDSSNNILPLGQAASGLRDTVTVINETRFWVRLVNLGARNKSKAMAFLRSKVQHAPWSMEVYDVSFPLAEQYDAILPSILTSVATAGVCMILVSLLFIPNILTSLLIGFTVVSINAGVIAYMGAWDIRLDIISLITILLSIGFSVDFASHVSYHYVHCRFSTPKDRLVWALNTVGWPILQSSLSTIVGVLPMAYVEAYITHTFVKTVLLVMIVGLYHGLVILPVALPLLTQMRSCSSVAHSLDLNNSHNVARDAVPRSTPPNDKYPTEVENDSRTIFTCQNNIATKTEHNSSSCNSKTNSSRAINPILPVSKPMFWFASSHRSVAVASVLKNSFDPNKIEISAPLPLDRTLSSTPSRWPSSLFNFSDSSTQTLNGSIKVDRRSIRKTHNEDPRRKISNGSAKKSNNSKNKNTYNKNKSDDKNNRDNINDVIANYNQNSNFHNGQKCSRPSLLSSRVLQVAMNFGHIENTSSACSRSNSRPLTKPQVAQTFDRAPEEPSSSTLNGDIGSSTSSQSSSTRDIPPEPEGEILRLPPSYFEHLNKRRVTHRTLPPQGRNTPPSSNMVRQVQPTGNSTGYTLPHVFRNTSAMKNAATSQKQVAGKATPLQRLRGSHSSDKLKRSTQSGGSGSEDGLSSRELHSSTTMRIYISGQGSSYAQDPGQIKRPSSGNEQGTLDRKTARSKMAKNGT